MAVVRTPVAWLREYVDLPVAPGEVAKLLTLAGLETKIENPRAATWERIWVGRVERLERHPNADKLLLATVDYGHGRKRVVTGAANLQEGDVVPYAEVGAQLVDGRTHELATLEPKTIRGVKSEGMVCSELELGLGEDHEGILVLDPIAQVGRPLADVLGEPVLVSELRPNRPDALGVLGIAREVAALLDLEVREPPLDLLPSRAPEDFAVEIEDTEGCLRLTAAFLRGVKIGPSPAWLAERLEAAGMRPINNVVDITNYVMLETGQPLHAFDRHRLRGATLRARRAAPAERLRTLEGLDRELDPRIVVVADAEGAVGIAGIVGGEESEIGDDTTEVVLEVAKWENRRIWRTMAKLRAQTESGKRFSWDISPELPPYAQRRALRLLRELAGAEAVAYVDRYPAPRDPVNIRVPFTRIAQVLGVALPHDAVTSALHRVGCHYALDGDTLIVTPPPWRTDITIAEDVIEEAARIVGYEHIPTHIPSGPLPLHARHPLEEFRERVRDALVGQGLQEIVSYPLVDPRWLAALTADGSRAGPEPLGVTNPLSVEQSVLRTTLLPSLLDAARRNLRWVDGVALFEIGKVYLPRPADLPDERWTVGIILVGRADESPRHWLAGQARPFDLFDLRAALDATAEALGFALPEPEVGAALLHPGRSYTLRGVGRVGQLDPRVAERWELPPETFVAELDLAALAPGQRALLATLPARYPAADRDLAVAIDEAVTWAALREEVRSAGGKHLRAISLLDVYRGPQVGEGRKSVAMRLVFQSDEGTLSEAELERAMRRIVARLERTFKATPRE